MMIADALSENAKNILITGAGSGIGYETALLLAQSGCNLILVCRERSNGEAALQSIQRISNNPNIQVFICDLSSQNNIHRLAKSVQESFPKLDVLINNAGCNYSTLQFSEDNIEMQFTINHLAPFLLTHLLLDSIQKSAQGRIINLTSRAHARGSIHFEDIYYKTEYNAMGAYNQSKLANVFFTYELAKRLKDTSVTVNCVQPGLVSTGIGNKHASRFHNFVWTILKKLGRPPQEAAKEIVHLALSDEVRTISGAYFSFGKQQKSSRLSYDKTTSEKLWALSEQLTAIKYR